MVVGIPISRRASPQAGIFRAKIVSPHADAMRLVYRQQRRAQALQGRLEIRR